MYYDKYNIYNCPQCHQKYAILNCGSQNSMGADVYSDGKAYGKMLDDSIDILKCRICENVFWLREINYHSSLPVNNSNELSKKDILEQNSFTDVLKIDDLFEFIRKGHTKNRGEEFYVRQNILWMYNDRFRAQLTFFQSENDKKHWKQNLLRLLNLLQDSDYSQLLKAEIYRYLGEFKKSINTLELIKDEENTKFKHKIIDACKEKNKNVFKLVHGKAFFKAILNENGEICIASII